MIDVGLVSCIGAVPYGTSVMMSINDDCRAELLRLSDLFCSSYAFLIDSSILLVMLSFSAASSRFTTFDVYAPCSVCKPGVGCRTRRPLALALLTAGWVTGTELLFRMRPRPSSSSKRAGLVAMARSVLCLRLPTHDSSAFDPTLVPSNGLVFPEKVRSSRSLPSMRS